MRIQYESELYHHGIKGQKWGVRKYQNTDGSYTDAGRKRYARQLTKQFNKGSENWNRADYGRGKAEKSATRARNFAKRTDTGILKPISKLSTAYANRMDKSAKKYSEKADKHLKLANEAMELAKKEGFTAKTYTKPTLVDVRYYGAITEYITRRSLQARFEAPVEKKAKSDKVHTKFAKSRSEHRQMYASSY